MNALIVGTNKDAVLDYIPSRNFMLIDDGRLIDRITERAREFDVKRHSFNPLDGMNHKLAREFSTIIYAAEPGGQDTLTARNGKRALSSLILGERWLQDVSGNRKDPAIAEALGMLDNLLFSPLVRRVLCNPNNFALTGTILVRLNRATLGDYDCRVLANLLISRYAGTVVIPDFGFYAHQGHIALMRQDRLVAGVHTLSEVPSLTQQLLLSQTRVATQSTAEDAATLAQYEGLIPGTIAHSDFVFRAIS